MRFALFGRGVAALSLYGRVLFQPLPDPIHITLPVLGAVAGGKCHFPLGFSPFNGLMDISEQLLKLTGPVIIMLVNDSL